MFSGISVFDKTGLRSTDWSISLVMGLLTDRSTCPGMQVMPWQYAFASAHLDAYSLDASLVGGPACHSCVIRPKSMVNLAGML